MLLPFCRKVRLLILVVAAAPSLAMAAPDILPRCIGDSDITGNFRVYRMETGVYDCPLPPAITPVDIEFDCRNATVPVYHATGSITFGPGFATLDGDIFSTAIDPVTFGILTGRSLQLTTRQER